MEAVFADIAADWHCSLVEAASRLMPAGAVYHGMNEADVQRFLQAPFSMMGSDGLPCDPQPHPRLWGAFPRVLGHYSRDLQLFSLPAAIHKMTALSARNFQLAKRGKIGMAKTGFVTCAHRITQQHTNIQRLQRPGQPAADVTDADYPHGLIC